MSSHKEVDIDLIEWEDDFPKSPAELFNKKEGLHPCPICSKYFPSNQIEDHVNVCLTIDGGPSNFQVDPFEFHEPSIEESDREFIVKMLAEEEEQKKKKERENERLLKEFLEKEQKQLRDSGNRFKCPICTLESNDVALFFFLDGCNHGFCLACLKKFILENVSQKTISKIQCKTCNRKILVRDIKELLTENEYAEYEVGSLQEVVQNNDQFVSCPNANCKNVIEKLGSNASNKNDKETGADGQPLSKEAIQHKNENRFRCRECSTEFCSGCKTVPYHLGFTCAQFQASKAALHCRFCDSIIPNNQKNLVCNKPECQDKLKGSCNKILPCNHLCNGIAGENECLSCLHPDCSGEGAQTGEDYCNICWVESLSSAPCIRIKCGHVFHFTCLNTKLQKKWPTPAISFNFATCPLCKEPIEHPALESELDPLNQLMKHIRGKAGIRLKMEGMEKEWDDPALKAKFPKPEDYALHVFAYYMCFKCQKPYFGGKKSCVGAMDENLKFDPKDLLCGACSGDQNNCKTHGNEFIEFKCRFCCSLATFFCGGKAHFCTPCHTIAGQLVEFTNWTTIKECAPCPGPGKCPLGMDHLANGVECPLGCSMCRAENAFELGGDADKKGKEEKPDDKNAKKPWRVSDMFWANNKK